MSSSGRPRGWRPANAQTFSFGPVLCHCMHGVPEQEDEVALDREEIRRGGQSTQLQAGTYDRSGMKRNPSKSTEAERSRVQLPQNAVPERQARPPLRDTSTASLSTSLGNGNAGHPPAPGKMTAGGLKAAHGEPPAVVRTKVWTYLLLVWVGIGLLALAAGHPTAEQLYDSLEERVCKLRSETFKPIPQDGLDRYNLSPFVTCLVHLDVRSGAANCTQQNPSPGCWKPAAGGGWFPLMFDRPQDFLQPRSAETCARLVRRYAARTDGFACDVELSGRIAVPAAGRWGLSPLILELHRHREATLTWLVIASVLLLVRLCGGARKLCLVSRMWPLFKAAGVLLTLSLVAAGAAMVLRYPAAQDLVGKLQEGQCSLTGPDTAVVAAPALGHAVVCVSTVTVEGQTFPAASLAFAASAAGPLQCKDLVEQVYAQKSFPCCYVPGAEDGLILAGKKDQWTPALVDGLLLSLHRAPYVAWYSGTLFCGVILLISTPSTLYSWFRRRREGSSDGYLRLPGR